MPKTSSSIDIGKYSDICYDSRGVSEGSVFVCLVGEKTDGHKFIDSAIEKGAKLIIVEKSKLDEKQIAEYLEKYSDKNIEILAVEDSKAELAKLSSLFYKEPSKNFRLIGITGTNGKTTVSHLVQKILSWKCPCPILGTMGLKKSSDSEYVDFGMTTPQSTDLQKFFADLAKDFSENSQSDSKPYLAMEVSSHALEQKRVGSISFKAALITNLTQDHLDYHVTMDRYFEAKAKIFDQTSDYVLLNLDDDYYEKFLNEALKRNLRIISYGLKANFDDKKADLSSAGRIILADQPSFNDKGLNYELLEIRLNKKAGINEEMQLASLSLKLNGMFNVYNSLAAIGLGLEEGISIEDIKNSLEEMPAVAGRFEVISEKGKALCIVDYAHSPDGLENILHGARALKDSDPSRSNGKLICLFGCGGDRDITKRPKMAKIAYDLSDYVYVSSDNPRTEDPNQIISDILTGIPELSKVKVNPDRASAIKEAISNSNPEDIVVIAGKGHENYQILPTGTIHFDDREEVQKSLLDLSVR